MSPYRHSGASPSDSNPVKRASFFPAAALRASATPVDPAMNEKIGVIQSAIEREEQGDKVFDPELEGQEAPKRPFLLTHAMIVGLAMILVVVVEMACVAKVSGGCQLTRVMCGG